MGAAAVANGADCLVLDVEGQYEGKYPQASYFMSSLRSQIGPDYSVRARQLPVRRLSPGAALFGLPRSRGRPVQRPAALLEGHRDHRRSGLHPHLGLEPDLRAADRRRSVRSTTSRRRVRSALPRAGDVAWLRRRQLVVVAVGRQAAVEGGRLSGLAGGRRAVPELSLPACGLEGGLRRLGAAAAGRRRVLGPDQRLLPGPRRRRPCTRSRRTTACLRPATSTSRPGAFWCRTSRSP